MGKKYYGFTESVADWIHCSSSDALSIFRHLTLSLYICIWHLKDEYLEAWSRWLLYLQTTIADVFFNEKFISIRISIMFVSP